MPLRNRGTADLLYWNPHGRPRHRAAGRGDAHPAAAGGLLSSLAAARRGRLRRRTVGAGEHPYARGDEAPLDDGAGVHQHHHRRADASRRGRRQCDGVHRIALRRPQGSVPRLRRVRSAGMDRGDGAGVPLRAFRRHARGRREAPVVLPEEGATLGTQEPPTQMNVASWTVFAVMMGITLHAPGVDAELVRIAFSFFRTGLGAYGGGFAIVPHLKQVVEREHWITERQFADAVAIGKLTPGPVLLLATFIGYLRHGWLGAVVATIGIFAAPFALVATAGTWLDRIRSRRPVRAALRGLTPAVLGLMAAAVISLGDTINGEGEIAIAIAVGLTLSRFEINPAGVLPLRGGGPVGLRLAGVVKGPTGPHSQRRGAGGPAAAPV